MIDNLIRAATCRVLCGSESGTGQLITNDRILTARHCVIEAIESGNIIEFTFFDQKEESKLVATVVADSVEFDVCILSIPDQLERKPILLNAEMPREGCEWRSFGFPSGKTTIGHRICGNISHLLDSPKLKMDIDLTVDSEISLPSYQGFSGAAVVSAGASIGMIKLQVPGTIGAISIHQLVGFLAENGVEVPEMGAFDEPRDGLADRGEFQETFEQKVTSNPGDYIFLEGAHGIGKTTFCREFVPENEVLYTLGAYSLVSKERGPGVIARAQPEVFFDWLSSIVTSLLTGKPSRKEDLPYADMVEKTAFLLDQFSKYCESNHKQGVLFVDGLNEAQAACPDALVKLIGLLPEALPPAVTIILTAPNYHDVSIPLFRYVKSQNKISLPPLSNEASSIYCWQELAEERVTSALVAGICDKAQGHPLYLRYLIEYANSSSEEDSLDDFPTLTGSIEEYYESLWPRLLEDADAIQLLGIVARLRWGIKTSDLLEILSPTEQTVFIPTVSRIRHLLLNPDFTTVYHPSFTEFLLSKTIDLEVAVQQRLAEYCIKESTNEYCALNVVFHLLRSVDADLSRAVVACDQNWVDTCVELGVEPDTLLFDIEATLSAAMDKGETTEVIRLLLLSQRVGFRYNTLFAQSARLIADALISLKRPQQALKHAIRFNNLIVDPDEAFQIAFSLIQNEYEEEALELLEILKQRILEAHSSLGNAFDSQDFIHLCQLHIRVILFMHLADGQGGVREVFGVLKYAERVITSALKEDAPPELIQQCLVQIKCIPVGYFLCFSDEYATLDRLKKEAPEVEMPADFLSVIMWALLECGDSLEIYNLPNNLSSLSQVFFDIEELIADGVSFEIEIVSAVMDALIRFGAPSSIVLNVSETGQQLIPQPLTIKADNGVDVDFHSIHQGSMEWRNSAFLDKKSDCPSVDVFYETEWASSLNQLICALSWCEGKARLANAENNEQLQQQTLELLNNRVLQPLVFTLEQRVKWQDSYAIPEGVFPLIYERVTLLLMDCYPSELPTFLQGLLDRLDDQFGLYSEGFREAMFAVFERLLIQEVEPSIFDKVFELLQRFKEYVVHGVENRHELVPELLKLIPLFVKVGANEKAEELYQFMLGVSMGPSWYKEDQLGLMVSALRKIPTTENVQAALPKVAGYLERASGEMTFQRFVRYEKHAFIGELFRRGKIASGCRYFKRQTCGSTGELFLEGQHGITDKPSPAVGMRHSGGALDEQHAILYMVRKSKGCDWRLRWALLEIFQCGDERHIDNYAGQYAEIINQEGITAEIVSEMISRIEFVVGAEVSPADRSRFLKSFSKKLDAKHHSDFSSIAPQLSVADSKDEKNAPIKVVNSIKVSGSDMEDQMLCPGVMGRLSVMNDADQELKTSERNLKLGNLEDTKNHAVKVLSILQEGGWSVWGECSESSERAKALLLEGTTSASDLIQLYAPLLEAERYNEKWRIAESLLIVVVDLLQQDEREVLLQYVLSHIRLMVGDASNEIEIFSFLEEETSEDNSIELFRLVIWLLDHPKALRRDKAAGMVAWLIEMDPICFEEAVKQAFSMVSGYSADVFCCVIDEMSAQQPQELWDRVFNLLDLGRILQDCSHVGRLTVLHRIAERAGNVGSKTGFESASRIEEHFNLGTPDQCASGVRIECPPWARCISKEWKLLKKLGVLSEKLIDRFGNELTQLCTPLDIHGGWNLENAVLTSFRESPERRMNRWEAKVRFALNSAVFPNASNLNFREIESILRVFNPSLPERTLAPGFASPSKRIVDAITSGNNYACAIGDSDLFYLSYYGITERKDGQYIWLEVLAVVIPDAFNYPPFKGSSFGSKELPDLSSKSGSHETCCRLEPDFALFGSLTPAFPLPSFVKLIGANDSDFSRVNWRNGRSTDAWNLGCPVQEGCFLGVKRKAIHLPSGKALGWIIRVNGECVAMIDSQNNKLDR